MRFLSAGAELASSRDSRTVATSASPSIRSCSSIIIISVGGIVIAARVPSGRCWPLELPVNNLQPRCRSRSAFLNRLGEPDTELARNQVPTILAEYIEMGGTDQAYFEIAACGPQPSERRVEVATRQMITAFEEQDPAAIWQRPVPACGLDANFKRLGFADSAGIAGVVGLYGEIGPGTSLRTEARPQFACDVSGHLD